MKFKKYKLKDIGEVVGGATPLTSDDSNYDGDISWITPNDLSNRKSPYITRGERNITKKGLKEIGNRLYPKGTVLFSSRAPIGYVAIAKKELCTNQGFKSVIPNLAYTTPEYLYYTLDFYKKHIEKKGSGTTFKEVSSSVMENIELPFPSLENQERIANCLMSLDQKIALNTRMNAELEAMAKQLYDYWFVQFDFPFDFAQGKPDENGKPYKSSGGKMVWSEKLKREIPEGWEVKTLSNILILEDYRRIPLSNKERENKKGPFPYYGATGIMDYIDEYIFDGDYLLLAEDGSTSDENGNPVVQYIWGKNWVNNHAHIITLNNKNWLEYCYFLLKTIPVVLIETGSIQKKINQENLMSYNVAFPPDKLIESYCDITNTLREKQKQVTDEKNHLTHLRDSFLPMLMNGQVTIE